MTFTLSRAFIVVLAGLLALALTAQRAVAAPIIVCFPPDEDAISDPDKWICIVGPGITGGGSVETATGEAYVSLFATKLQVDGQPADGAPAGQVTWTDPGAGVEFETVEVTDYVPVPGQEGAREIRGTMSLNGSGIYPFVLRAVDGGPPGVGADSVTLAVGDQAAEGQEPTGFSYSAAGPLTGGDLQLVQFAEAVPNGTPPSEE